MKQTLQLGQFGVACALASVLISVLASAIAHAEDARRTFANPPRIKTEVSREPNTTLLNTVDTAPPIKQLDLNVVYTDSQLYNPAEGRWDKVRLRSYNGNSVTSSAPYVAPTIEAGPGETFALHSTIFCPQILAARNTRQMTP